MAYEEGNNFGAFQDHTNKYANEPNAIKLKIGKTSPNAPEVVADVTVTASNVAVVLGLPTTDYNHRYFRVTVIDQSGTIKSNSGTGNLVSVIVDTSTLNPSDTWLIQIFASTVLNVLNTDEPTSIELRVKNPATAGTIKINTLYKDSGELVALSPDKQTQFRAHSQSFDFGDFVQGAAASVDFDCWLKNIGKKVININAQAIGSGGVLSAHIPEGQFTIFPNKLSKFTITIDTTGTVGQKSGAVQVSSTDPREQTPYVQDKYFYFLWNIVAGA